MKPEQAAARDPAVIARSTIIGPSLVLDQVTKEFGLDKILKKNSSERYLQILSMGYFLTARGGPLSYLEAWSKSHAHPYGKVLKTLNQLELTKSHLVLDRGFYSQKNVDELLATGNKFVLAVPGKPKWVREIIDETKDSIQNPDNYHKMEGEVLYIHSRLLPWGKERKRFYLHLYYNAHAAAQATDVFPEELLAYTKELETGFSNSNHEDAYKTFYNEENSSPRPQGVF